MSIPIAYCAFVRAVDDAEALERLKRTLAYNLKNGAFTTVPCRCDPPCRELTEGEWDMLETALFGEVEIDRFG